MLDLIADLGQNYIRQKSEIGSEDFTKESWCNQIHFMQALLVGFRWSRSVISFVSSPANLWPPRLFCLWDFLGKSTGMGFYALLHGIFPTQRSKLPLLSPAAPALQADPLPLSHWGKPCFRYWGTANWTWAHPAFLHMEGMLSSMDKKEETRGT